MAEKKKGRPSKINDEMIAKIIELAEKGKTDKEISSAVGIVESTLTLWKTKNFGFSVSLKEAKQHADNLVEASLFQKATGYSHQVTKVFQYEGHTFEHDYIEKIPPDTTACIFWLKNRQPAEWRDRQEVVKTEETELKPEDKALMTEFVKKSEEFFKGKK